MKFGCPNCGQHIDADEEWVGKEATCPTCQNQFVVPSQTRTPPILPPEPLPSPWYCRCAALLGKLTGHLRKLTGVPSKPYASVHLNIPEREPYEGKATQKQKKYLWDLGFKDQDIIDKLGKEQASVAIDQMLVFYKKERSKRTVRTIGVVLIGLGVIGFVVTLSEKKVGPDFWNSMLGAIFFLGAGILLNWLFSPGQK